LASFDATACATSDRTTSETTATTGSYQDIPTGDGNTLPTVTITAPASGLVLVLYSAETTESASTAVGYYAPEVDNGGAADAYAVRREMDSSSATQIVRNDAHRLATVSAASHTWRLQYQVATASDPTFANRRITVLGINAAVAGFTGLTVTHLVG
jgi:hypothetical protein